LIVPHLGQLWAGLRRHREQIEIDAEEIGQGALGGGQRPQPGRHRRLRRLLVLVAEGVLVAFPLTVGRQPRQIQPSKVTSREFGANANDGRQS
jgi:hypothetical protein